MTLECKLEVGQSKFGWRKPVDPACQDPAGQIEEVGAAEMEQQGLKKEYKLGKMRTSAGVWKKVIAALHDQVSDVVVGFESRCQEIKQTRGERLLSSYYIRIDWWRRHGEDSLVGVKMEKTRAKGKVMFPLF